MEGANLQQGRTCELYREYQLTMDGSLIMLGTNGTINTTTNIDIASPSKDEENQEC